MAKALGFALVLVAAVMVGVAVAGGKSDNDRRGGNAPRGGNNNNRGGSFGDSSSDFYDPYGNATRTANLTVPSGACNNNTCYRRNFCLPIPDCDKNNISCWSCRSILANNFTAPAGACDGNSSFCPTQYQVCLPFALNDCDPAAVDCWSCRYPEGLRVTTTRAPTTPKPTTTAAPKGGKPSGGRGNSRNDKH